MENTYHDSFIPALKESLEIEGGYSFDSKDPGGETLFGISRFYWPDWPGWDLFVSGETDIEVYFPLLCEFYHTHFWLRFRGDKIANLSTKIARELLDTSINLDVPDAVRFLQTALNLQNENERMYKDLKVDGKLGPNTFNALEKYLVQPAHSFAIDEQILLVCMNGEQYIHYKQNPQIEYFRGLFRRLY